MKHQSDGISVGAIRTARPIVVTCNYCGVRYPLNKLHYCELSHDEAGGFYSPVAKLTPPRPPKRVREGGC